MKRIRDMQGLEIKGLDTIFNYGYRGTLSKDEACTVCTEEGEPILKIEAFNEMCKLRIQFIKEGRVTLADWAYIEPKKETKGMHLFYENNDLTYGKEFFC